MKKRTKAIFAAVLAAIGISSCERQYEVYGPGPDIQDNTNDVIQNMIRNEPTENVTGETE